MGLVWIQTLTGQDVLEIAAHRIKSRSQFGGIERHFALQGARETVPKLFSAALEENHAGNLFRSKIREV